VQHCPRAERDTQVRLGGGGTAASRLSVALSEPVLLSRLAPLAPIRRPHCDLVFFRVFLPSAVSVRGGARPQRHKGKGRNHVDRQPAGGGSGPHLSRAEARALFHRRKADVALMRAIWTVASRARPPTPPMRVQQRLGGRKGNKRQRRRGFVYTMHIMMPCPRLHAAEPRTRSSRAGSDGVLCTLAARPCRLASAASRTRSKRVNSKRANTSPAGRFWWLKSCETSKARRLHSLTPSGRRRMETPKITVPEVSTSVQAHQSDKGCPWSPLVSAGLARPASPKWLV
jgi:hypothetical protein